MRKSPKHIPISGDAVVNTVWGNWFDDLTRSNLVVLSQSARVEVDKDFYVLDGASNPVTLTLSERNESGHQLGISCINSTNACTIDLNGNMYYGSPTSLSLSAGGYYYLKWTGSQWVGIKGSSTGGGGGGVSDHNDLTGLQGGTTDEYYHLSNADYTEAVAFLNGGSTTHTGLDGHISNTSIHFTQANIDHTAILNRGTNTHAQIDTHIANTSNPHSVTANQVLPSQSGNSGKVLTTDGTNTSWATVSGGGGGSSYMPSGW